MKALFRWAAALALVGTAVFWWVTRPVMLDAGALAGLTPDLAAGEQVFYAGGCAACHAAPDASGDARLTLSGGQAFPSPFGTFRAPNISSDPDHGIGGWSALDLANAMKNGVSPEGQHYFPAFPYTSYAKAQLSDIVSLHAFLATLPASTEPSKPHEVGFPFNIRRSLGGWKRLFLGDAWVVAGDLTAQETRGRYLAEALGHCGECHTPRNVLGGLQFSQWLGGAPDPSGKGRVPNITPGKLLWSEADIAEYLKSGFTPEFDTAGGHMVAVVENTAHLTPEDRAAIAAYVKRVMPVQ
ncbi:MAG: cytochrome c [Rhodobacter sp.]|nr:cytochrome c [Rhodobacter sp.]